MILYEENVQIFTKKKLFSVLTYNPLDHTRRQEKKYVVFRQNKYAKYIDLALLIL